jgi:hypothetical protein
VTERWSIGDTLGATPGNKDRRLRGRDGFRELLLPEMDLGSLASGAGTLIGEAIEGCPGIPTGLTVPLFRFVPVTARTLKQMDLFPLSRAHSEILPHISMEQ